MKENAHQEGVLPLQLDHGPEGATQADSPIADYVRVLESLRAIVWQADFQKRVFTSVSPPSRTLLGYRPEEWLEPDFLLNHVHPDDLPELRAMWEAPVGIGRTRQFEFRMFNADGRMVWLRNIVPIQEGHGGPDILTGVMVDVSQAKQIEANLRKERDFTASIMGTAGILVVMLDPQGRIVRFNRGCEKVTGYSFEQVRGKTVWNLLPVPEERESVTAVFDQLRTGSPSARNESHWLTKDGRPRLIAWSNSVLRNDDGTVEYIISTGIDITERKQVEEELRKQTARAQESSRLKTEFLANMSHELHTPMNGIIGFADLLASEQLSSQQKDWVDIIRNCGRDLMALIDDILDVSKIEANELRVELCQFGISDMLGDVVRVAAPDIEAKGLSLSLECDPSLPRTMNSDPQRLRQILTNLLNNARKFTDSGTITVRAGSGMLGRTPAVQLEVSDTGIGIAPEHQEIIFETFKQADTSASRKYQGSGLGLAICKRLAGLLGGNIRVQSKPQQGSTFIVSLPLDAPVAAGGDLNPDVADQAEHQHSQPGQRDTGHPEGILQLQGHILLAESNQVNRNLFHIMLERVGIEVDLAEDSRHFVELAGSRQYDLLLIDAQMPWVNGLECTRILRGKGLTTPIIALTDQTMSQEHERCLEAGCDGFLVKPLNQGMLLAAVQEYLPGAPTPSAAS